MLRLLFVADDIPDPLKRVVEFLNMQMRDVEVLAVEIKQFHGTSTQTLVPRVIGRIEKPTTGAGERRRLTRESFLAALLSDQVRSTAARLLDVSEKHGAALEWGMGCGIIKAPCPRVDNPVSVAWLFVPGGHFRYQSEFTFGSRLSDQWPPDRPMRELLERWADQFSADAFTTKKVGRNWVVGYDAAAQHVGLLEDRLARVLSELKEL